MRLAILFLVAALHFLTFSCNQPREKNIHKEGISFKELILKDSLAFLEYFDSTTNFYSNYYYGFSVAIPEGWGSDRGVSKNTVFRISNYDSGIVFSVTINKPFSEADLPKSIWNPLLEDSLGYTRQFVNGIKTQINTQPLNFDIQKTFYVNQEALKSKYSYLFRSDELEYYMYTEIFQFIYKQNVFTVGLNIPKEFYDSNNSYKMLKNNFTLIPIKYE